MITERSLNINIKLWQFFLVYQCWQIVLYTFHNFLYSCYEISQFRETYSFFTRLVRLECQTVADCSKRLLLNSVSLVFKSSTGVPKLATLLNSSMRAFAFFTMVDILRSHLRSYHCFRFLLINNHQLVFCPLVDLMQPFLRLQIVWWYELFVCWYVKI